MTDMTEQSERDVENDYSLTDPRHGKLAINTSLPSTVYIKAYVTEGSPTISGFGASADGPFYKDGIKWQSNAEYAMFLTLVLLPGVVSVDCDDLPYSPTYGSEQATQNLCIVNLAPKSYQFYVKFPDGQRHDPKIVVTLPSLPGT